jgi:hypothetical protein
MGGLSNGAIAQILSQSGRGEDFFSAAAAARTTVIDIHRVFRKNASSDHAREEGHNGQ